MGLFDRVLVCVAHADDEVLLAGGTIARFAVEEDKMVYVVCFSRHRGVIESPADEFYSSMDSLGIVPPAAMLHDIPACQQERPFSSYCNWIYSELENVRDRLSPTCVITHPEFDRNQDHQVIRQVVLQVFRGWYSILGGTFIHNEQPLGDKRLFVRLDQEHVSRKVIALRQYASQVAAGRSYMNPDAVWNQARYFGLLSGDSYGLAEAFEITKLVLV